MLFQIQKKRIDEYWETPCRKTAVVSQLPSNKAILAVYDNGEELFRHEYDSRKGAVIAMSKRYGKCKFHHMVDVLESRRVTE